MADLTQALEKTRQLLTQQGRTAQAQEVAQVDPWAERVAGRDAHEFAAMATLGHAEAAE